MENLSSHKRPAVREAIRSAGAKLLFLPPYSPDLNPIEQVFAKLKYLLRKPAQRSHKATGRRIGTLLDPSRQQNAATTSLTRIRIDVTLSDSRLPFVRPTQRGTALL